MSVTSFAEALTSSHLEFDLIVIGSGPAGLTIANAFRDSPFRICILESGGIEPKKHTEALNKIVNVGQRRADPELVRRRCFGGTSTIWTGRCGVFDAVDYQSREWLELSGWPINDADLEDQTARARELLGLSNLSVTDALRDLVQSFDQRVWDQELLSPVVWEFSSQGSHAVTQHFADNTSDLPDPLAILRHSGRKTPVDFGRAHIQWLRGSANVHLIIHATALEIVASPSGRSVTGVRLCGPDGNTRVLNTSRIVLACGGIDNARLLLTSRGVVSVGLGNDRDQVGRYLADHTFTELGSFARGKAILLRRRFGSRLHTENGVSHTLCFGVRLSPTLQHQEALMNSAAHLVEFGTRLSPIATLAEALRELRNGTDIKRAASLFASAVARPVDLTGGIFDRLVLKRAVLNDPDKTILGCVVEQKLTPESRIRLSRLTDCFGSPLPEVDWRMDEAEFRTARRFREILLADISRLGMDMPDAPDWADMGIGSWRDSLIDLAHPMCTTRMSNDPRTGVVDSNCKVHGVTGLYVAGNSVFATPSHMNPTRMIVTFALRLADHLQASLRAAFV